MRLNRSSMSLLFALCAVVACSDEGDGLNDSQESLRRGQLADGGSVQGRRDRDDDDAHDGGKRGRDEGDGGKGRGRFDDDHGDGGCEDRGGRDDFGGKHDHEREDDDRGPRGGKGPGGWKLDGGVAP